MDAKASFPDAGGLEIAKRSGVDVKRSSTPADADGQLLKELFDFIHPALALRAVLGTAFGSELIKLAQQVFLAVGQFDWRLHHNMTDRKSTRLNSSHEWISRMPSSA